METYEKRGRWWRPEQPDNQVPGVLRFSNKESITLELDGVFDGREPWTNIDRIEAPFLLNGVTGDGSLVTLVDAQRAGSMRSSVGYDQESYIVEWVIRGACIEQEENLSFDCQRLWYSGISDWWSRSGLDSNGPIELDGDGHRTSKIAYTEQDPLIAVLTGAELAVLLLWRDSGSRPRRRMEIRKELLLRVRSDAPLAWNEWNERYEAPLRELLTLTTGRPVLLDRTTVESSAITGEVDGHAYNVPLEIDRQQHEPGELSSTWHPWDMLFSLDDVAHDLAGVFQRWTEVRERYVLARQLYFSTRYAPYVYRQTEFVYLVQSCESYHAIRFKRRGRQTADAHAKAVEEVLATIPERHAEWVEQRLRPRSSISLADRLLFLVHEHDAIIGPMLEDAEDFCHRAAATRHYLTHGTRRSAAVLTDMRDILFGGWVLRTLFEACMLTELGIIPSISVNPFEGTSRYEHLKAHPLTLSSAVGRPQK